MPLPSLGREHIDEARLYLGSSTERIFLGVLLFGNKFLQHVSMKDNSVSPFARPIECSSNPHGRTVPSSPFLSPEDTKTVILGVILYQMSITLSNLRSGR